MQKNIKRNNMAKATKGATVTKLHTAVGHRLEDVANSYFEDAEIYHAPRTVATRKERLGPFLRFMQTQHPEIETIEDMTTDTIREYAAHLRALRTGGKALSPYTINGRIRMLRGLFNFALERGIRFPDGNPALAAKKLREEEHVVEPLTNKQVRDLLAAPDKDEWTGLRNYTILVTMLDTGMRLNEIVTLQMGDVDLKAGTIHVRAEISKTRRARIIYLSKRGIADLRVWLRDRFGGAKTDCPIIFPSSIMAPDGEGFKPMTSRTVQRMLQVYAEKAGIKKAHPHMLRHTYAVMYLEAGGDVVTLAQQLGHSDLSMTKRYLNVANRQKVAASIAERSPMMVLRPQQRRIPQSTHKGGRG